MTAEPGIEPKTVPEPRLTLLGRAAVFDTLSSPNDPHYDLWRAVTSARAETQVQSGDPDQKTYDSVAHQRESTQRLANFASVVAAAERTVQGSATPEDTALLHAQASKYVGNTPH